VTLDNKYFSNRQEQTVANYLGWRVVRGSGARPMHPGDIEGSDWIGECKTHTKLKSKVAFNQAVWAKLCNEATSKMKKPVLIVDSGTQRVDDTWVMVPTKLLPVELLNSGGFVDIDDKGKCPTTLSLDVNTLRANTDQGKILNRVGFGNMPVSIMTLMTFNSILRCEVD